jgi:protein phosphatase
MPENLIVVGDIHGDIQTLNQILSEVNARNFLVNPKNKMIFLGDYVDRGSGSVEVLCRICELKIQYPDSVVLMRGNHEAVREFPFINHDLPIKISEIFGSSKEIVYEKIYKFFQLLNVIVIIEKKLFLVHGGLPVNVDTNHKNIRSLLENQEHYTLEDFLWNDPRPIETWEVSRRRFGKHFGRIITKRWLDASDTCVIIRGHEPCHGFIIDHDGMILTIFSCKESYPDFDAAYLIINNIQLEEITNADELSKYVRIIKIRRDC